MYLVRINAVDETASKDLFIPVVGELVFGCDEYRHAKVKIPSLFGERLFDTNWWAEDPVSGPIPMDCFAYGPVDKEETIQIVSAIAEEERLIVYVINKCPGADEDMSWLPRTHNSVVRL